MTHVVLGVFVVVAGAISVRADGDISGRWLLKMDRDYRGNPGVPVECTFRQKGILLTVRCGSGAEMKGEVRGRNVTWGFEKTGIPPMVEDRLVLSHVGESNKSANALKGTWTLRSSVLDEHGTFEATKR